MVMRFAICLLPLLAWATTASSEVVQLKDKSAITGKIVADKPDQIFVEVGYTVLPIPRGSIERIERDEATPPSKSAPPVTSKARNVLYYLTAPEVSERPVRDLVSQLGEAVVQVRTPGGLGSGFLVNEDGYLITNFHVIEGETQISVEVYAQKSGQMERKSYKQVKIVAMNKFADLALLRIEDKEAPRFAFVPLGNANAVSVGERVFAIGSPLGLERTVTEGIVSTKTRELQGTLYLQTTAQINPGNSGGPLFDLRGEVVGVTNMKANFSEGLGFAIPVEEVVYFLDHREAFAYDNENPNNAYRYLEPPSRTRP